MNRIEQLLIRVSEECNEVGQRCSKGLLFTLGEIQPGQELTNAQRIVQEYGDLVAVVDMLKTMGVLDLSAITPETIKAKQDKVEKFLLLSEKNGTYEPDSTGTAQAAETRAACNGLSEEERQNLKEKAKEIIDSPAIKESLTTEILYYDLIPGKDVWKEGDEFKVGAVWKKADKPFGYCVSEGDCTGRRLLPTPPEGWTNDIENRCFTRVGDGVWIPPLRSKVLKADEEWHHSDNADIGTASAKGHLYRLPWPDGKGEG